MAKWTYESTKAGYAKMWNSISIKATDAKGAARFASIIIAGEQQYRAVELQTGVPWFWIGAIHMRESSCNFTGVLHNGEHIIGTGRKTVLVPAGRGPFAHWSQSAIDALDMKSGVWSGKVWCPSLMAYAAELYNGTGYVGRKTNSPYVWAGSNHEQFGKYVADHKWDGNFDDPQVGVMTVIKALCTIRPDVASVMQEDVPQGSIAKHMTIKNVAMATVGTGSAGAAVSQTDVQGTINDASGMLDTLMPIVHMFQNYGTTIAATFTISVVVGTVAWHFYEKYKAENV